jgi:monoterpene epsilon-lactone hydrolase
MVSPLASKFPVPNSVSPAAQAYLAQEAHPASVFPEHGDTRGWKDHVVESDNIVRDMTAEMPLPDISEVRDVGGVPTYVMRAPGVVEEGPIYLGLHGGALIYCGGDLTPVTLAPEVYSVGMTVWGPDYRMPPEHPFPAGLDDCMTVYRGLLEIRDPKDIFVGGTSAGGNLAAALLLRVKEEGLPMPAALVLNSPEIDLTESGDSFQLLSGVHSGVEPYTEVNALYAAGASLSDPYLSPLFGDLSGFPPTIVLGGTRDLYLSNSVRIHRKLRADGVQADLHVFEAMPHAGFMGAPEDEELGKEVHMFLAHHRSDGSVPLP